MGSFGEYFLFYGLTEFIYAHRFGLKALSSSSCPRFFLLSLPGAWRQIHPHLFTTTSVPKLIFLFPISTDGRRGLFPLGILANHLASIFFLPLSGDSLGLLYIPVPHSLPIRSQSTNICWFPF